MCCQKIRYVVHLFFVTLSSILLFVWMCYWNACGCSIQSTFIRTFNKTELHAVWHKVLKVAWQCAIKMLDWESRNSLWPVRSHDLTNEKNFCVCISCSCSAFPCFQGEVKEVQDSVSKTTLPVNISVLSSTWQQFECRIDVCYVNGNTVESRSIVFEGDGENKRWMRKNDQSKYVVLSSSKVS